MGLGLLDEGPITSLTLLATRCTIARVSFPSSRIDVYEGMKLGKYTALRTFVHHRDLIIDISHFTTYALDLVIYPCYFVVGTMSERQELCRCHPNFILRQLIQSFKSVLDLRLS